MLFYILLTDRLKIKALQEQRRRAKIFRRSKTDRRKEQAIQDAPEQTGDGVVIYVEIVCEEQRRTDRLKIEALQWRLISLREIGRTLRLLPPP